MHVSTKGRYGTRALLALAEHQGEGPISSSTIASEQNISQKYLERLWPSLKKAGLVKVRLGVTGGYELSRQPEEISMYEILTALGENFDIVFCTGEDPDCDRADYCASRVLWQKLHDTVVQTLQTTKLDELQECLEELERMNGSPEGKREKASC